jgi:hypothetical protein
MVSGSGSEDVDFFIPEEQGGHESEDIDYFIPEEQASSQTQESMKKPSRSNFLWNAEKKRPQTILLALVAVFTLIFLSYAIVATLNSFRTIDIVIEYPGNYYGHIEYSGEYDSFSSDSGRREFSYTIREGFTVDVRIHKHVSGTSLMTIEIYDNGKLVMEVFSDYEERRVEFDFVVGDY